MSAAKPKAIGKDDVVLVFVIRLTLFALLRFVHIFLEREYAIPVVLHADDNPAFLVRISHERIAERSDFRLRPIHVLTPAASW